MQCEGSENFFILHSQLDMAKVKAEAANVGNYLQFMENMIERDIAPDEVYVPKTLVSNNKIYCAPYDRGGV